MTTTTTTNFNDLAQILAALGNVTRLRILEALKAHPGATVLELEAFLDLPQSVVSRHLMALRRRGIVVFDEGEGGRSFKMHRYSLRGQQIGASAEALAALA